MFENNEVIAAPEIILPWAARILSAALCTVYNPWRSIHNLFQGSFTLMFQE